MINCEIQRDFSQSKNCIIPGIFNTPEIVPNPANLLIVFAPATLTTSVLIQINSTTIYVLVATLFRNENIKLVKELKNKSQKALTIQKKH